MQLDFTGLNQIGAAADFKEEPQKKQAAQIAQERRDAPGEYKNTSGAENAATGLTEGYSASPTLQREADQRKQTLQSAADVYKRYQENIKATELLQSQVLKGIRAQEDIYSLFLKATKALSLTISNREFYAQILRELPESYPEALDAAQAAPRA